MVARYDRDGGTARPNCYPMAVVPFLPQLFSPPVRPQVFARLPPLSDEDFESLVQQPLQAAEAEIKRMGRQPVVAILLETAADVRYDVSAEARAGGGGGHDDSDSDGDDIW